MGCACTVSSRSDAITKIGDLLGFAHVARIEVAADDYIAFAGSAQVVLVGLLGEVEVLPPKH